MKSRLTTSCLVILLCSSTSFASTAIDNELLITLGDSPSEQVIQNAYQANPEQVLTLLSALLENSNVEAQFAISEALISAPDQIEAIAELSREYGIGNEIITTAALLAGLDPTEVSEATAAGIPTVQSAPLAPPAAPAVGSNGGGGFGVVSPN